MKNISICDISLKNTTRENKSNLTFKEKLEIVKKINELSVDVIEFSNVCGDKTEEVFIKTACAFVKNVKISVCCENSLEGVENAFSLISSAKNKRLSVVIPVSPTQMEYAIGKKPAAVLELMQELLKKATSLCDDVEIIFDDATHADSAFLHSAISSAVALGVKTVTVCDNAGDMQPFEISEFIAKIYAGVEDLKSVKLGIYLSDAFSMAIANALSAIKAGVCEIKISAIDNQDVLTASKLIKVMDVISLKNGYGLSLNKTGANRIINQIAELASSKNRNSFSTQSVEDVSEIDKNINKAELGKLIKKRGYDLSKEDFDKVYDEFLRLSDKKEVNTKELDVVIASIALQVPPTYVLNNFSIHISNLLTAVASITLSVGGEDKSGLSYGNGSIDAAFMAIESITGRHFELDDFEVSAITEGREAVGQTIVKLRSNGKLYLGRGVSTDIVGASIRAYLSALNKIAYEEKN